MISSISSLDESLMPPSAFLSTTERRIVKSTGFHTIKCDNFTQTTRVTSTDVSLNPHCEIRDLYDVHEIIRKINEEHKDQNQSIAKRFMEEKECTLKENKAFQNKCSELEKENVKLKCELSNMKMYITGVSNREEWIKEKQKLLLQIENLKQTQLDLESIIDSNKKQLINLEKIMCLQETELVKNVNREKPNKIVRRDNENFQNLLTAWRHKVLSLLVQQETADINFSKERQKFCEIIDIKDHLLSELHVEKEKLTLKLETAAEQIGNYKLELEKSDRENYLLKEEATKVTLEYNNVLNILNNVLLYIEQFGRRIESDIFVQYSRVNDQIEMLNRRLEFALSRFPVLRATICRKMNLLVNGSKSELDDVSVIDVESYTGLGKMEQLEEALVILKKELDQVRQERDKLCFSLESDSRTFHDRLNKKRKEVDEEMKDLRNQVQNLQMELSKCLKMKEVLEQENQRLKKQINEHLTEKHSDQERYQQHIIEKNNDVAKLQLEVDRIKKEYRKESNELQSNLNAMKQKLEESEYQWNSVCDSLMAENNVLKLTIRQEGILNKLEKTREDLETANAHKMELNKDHLMQEISNLTDGLINE